MQENDSIFRQMLEFGSVESHLLHLPLSSFIQVTKESHTLDRHVLQRVVHASIGCASISIQLLMDSRERRGGESCGVVDVGLKPRGTGRGGGLHSAIAVAIAALRNLLQNNRRTLSERHRLDLTGDAVVVVAHRTVVLMGGDRAVIGVHRVVIEGF